MTPIRRLLAAILLCILSGPNALAAPLSNARSLAIDLGYGVYQGAYNTTTQLNVWKGYDTMAKTRVESSPQ